MKDPADARPAKVSVVKEIGGKLANADAAIIADYRGLSVAALASLRRSLKDTGGEVKVYKNTLARMAATAAGHEGLVSMLVGPTAITFVKGDAAATAKTLRDYARTNPALVLRGGVVGSSVLSAGDVETLADLPPRDVLLAQIAGALQAPLVKTAGLLQALPRNFAHGLKALIDQREAA